VVVEPRLDFLKPIEAEPEPVTSSPGETVVFVDEYLLMSDNSDSEIESFCRSLSSRTEPDAMQEEVKSTEVAQEKEVPGEEKA